MTDDWVEFVEEYGSLVHASAWRILKDRQEAEDITQDVFAFAWSRRSEQVKNTAGWLRHLAVCRSLDRLRRRHGVVSSDLTLIATADNTSTAIEFAELEDVVRNAVAALPERQSNVFALRHFEGMSNREVAQHLGMSVSAVSTSLHAARSTLATVLTPFVQGNVK